MDKLIIIIISHVFFLFKCLFCFLCCFVYLDVPLKSTNMSCTLRFLIPVAVYRYFSIDKVLNCFSKK